MDWMGPDCGGVNLVGPRPNGDVMVSIMGGKAPWCGRVDWVGPDGGVGLIMVGQDAFFIVLHRHHETV